MSVKKDFFIDLDFGVCGTLSQLKDDSSEAGFVRVEYVPLNSFWAKKVRMPNAVRSEFIHTVKPTSKEKGVQEGITFILRGGEGSLMFNILESENLKTIAELREQIRGLKKELASAKQEASDAQAGVRKKIESMKDIMKTDRPASPFDNFPPRSPFGDSGDRGLLDSGEDYFNG